MKSKHVFLVIFSLIYSTVSAQVSSVKLKTYSKGNYNVSSYQSDMGGGGYITGILQDSRNSNVLYARSDVAGVFKSLDGGKSWTVKNSGLDKMSDHYCHSFAMDPFNNDVLLRASGDVRSFEFTGRLHRSTDGGETWKLVQDGLDYYGNGPTRQFGELIGFNPDKKGEAIAATFSKGVWISNDSGKTWRYGGLEGERMGSVQFCNNKIYVSTISDRFVNPRTKDPSVVDSQLEFIQDFRRNSKSRIYMSDNGGKTWNVLFESDDIPSVYEMVVVDKGQTIIFTSVSGIYRSDNGGKTFAQIPDLPAESCYRTIMQSPLEPSVFYTAEMIPTGGIKVPIYRSEDKGRTWKLISPDCKPEDLSKFPSWHGNSPEKLGDSRISHILPDNKDPQKLYISNWWGITITKDLGRSYCGNYFQGIGIICSEVLVQHPTNSNHLIAGVCDHGPALSVDKGKVFNTIQANYGPARALCVSKHDPNLILFADERKGEYVRLYKSVDLGKTAHIKWELGERNFIQDMKEDPTVKGRFWIYIEGDNDSKYTPGIYYSNDFGETWNKTATSPFSSLKTVPEDVFKIDKDLTPIVNYQHKNGCGTGQMFALDHSKEGVLYAGEWTTGIYRSMDNGKSWENVGRSLPFDKISNSILQFVYADPYREGTVYAGFWNTGLWKSEDFGATWIQLKPGGKSHFNASSMSISRSIDGKELIALACSNHPLGDTETALWITTNDGISWTNIYDYSIGCARFLTVVANASQQRIFTATGGNGVIYFDLSKNKTN